MSAERHATSVAVSCSARTADLRLRVCVLASYYLGLGAASAQDIRCLVQLSHTDPMASHLVLVPLISAALIWVRRAEIFAWTRTGWAGGLASITAGTALVLWTRMAHTNSPHALRLLVIGLLVQATGGFLFVFGPRAAMAARLPLAFLVFMVPIPNAVLDAVTGWLRDGSVHAIAALFTATGTPFSQHGYVFDLPTVSIEVAEACSGIRSSIALFLTAVVAGHLLLTTTFSKAALVLVTIPLAVLKNAIRIVVLSLLALHIDERFLTGTLHQSGGSLFFLVALAFLVPVVLHLRAHESGERQPADLLPSP